MPNKIAVIGIGNTLRRDDGIGVIILESLLKLYKKEGVDYLNFSVASFDLINRIREYDKVLIIDAMNAGLPAGEARIFNCADIENNADTQFSSTHEFNLQSLFKITKELAFKADIYIAGIQLEDASYGEGLSPVLKSKEKEISEKISRFIEQSLCFHP